MSRIEYFDVSYRNPGHWDIYDKTKRLCRIRGEAGNFCVYRDYGDIESKEGFNTVGEAMQYICGHYMCEPELVKVSA